MSYCTCRDKLINFSVFYSSFLFETENDVLKSLDKQTVSGTAPVMGLQSGSI